MGSAVPGDAILVNIRKQAEQTSKQYFSVNAISVPALVYLNDQL